MVVKTVLSFKAGTFSGKDYVGFIKNLVDFQIDKFSLDEIRDDELRYSSKYLDRIAQCSAEAELLLRSDKKDGKRDEEFWVMESAHPNTPQALYWCLHDRQPSLDIIKSLTSNENFTTGQVSDADFVRWQNETSISVYDYYSRPHSHLPKIYHKNFREWQIDTSVSPGRSFIVDHMWLQAAYIMYFGPKAFQVIDMEKILSYSDAYEIEQWDNGVIRFQLYKDLADSDKEHALHLMKNFREWIGMDEIKKKWG